jgi:aryl-alcohol dehydrogenase-like predicted oxidoreductase
MEYRRLGKSGLKVSEFSFGSWVTFAKQVDVQPAKELLTAAYDAGINFFDNAEGYEAGASELVMGQAIQELGWSRDSYIVSSKVFWGGEKPTQRGLSAKHVTEACHAALKRLRVDHLDLYFCHRPDIDTPIEETVRAMHNLILQGKVLYWGTSEWSGQQITEAHLVARRDGLTPPTMEQPQYNLFERERSNATTRRSMTAMASARRSGRPGLGSSDRQIQRRHPAGQPGRSAGLRVAARHHRRAEGAAAGGAGQGAGQDRRRGGDADPPPGAALVPANPRVSTVILGASQAGAADDNLKALDHKAKLTPDVLEAIEEVVQNKPEAPQRF